MASGKKKQNMCHCKKHRKCCKKYQKCKDRKKLKRQTKLSILSVSQAQEFDQGHALFLIGNVSYAGRQLNGHSKMSHEFARWLLETKKFSTAQVSSQNAHAEIFNFFEKLSKPNTLGVLCYVGHGNQYRNRSVRQKTVSNGIGESWEFGHITDQVLTHFISNIHKTSCIILISDSCFSDGILDDDSIEFKNHGRNVIFLSAARQDGPDGTRSAMYTFDGGFMTTCLVDLLMMQKDDQLTYKKIIQEMQRNPKYYAEKEPNEKTQLHLPRLRCYPEHLENDFAFELKK